MKQLQLHSTHSHFGGRSWCQAPCCQLVGGASCCCCSGSGSLCCSQALSTARSTSGPSPAQGSQHSSWQHSQQTGVCHTCEDKCLLNQAGCPAPKREGPFNAPHCETTRTTVPGARLCCRARTSRPHPAEVYFQRPGSSPPPRLPGIRSKWPRACRRAPAIEPGAVPSVEWSCCAAAPLPHEILLIGESMISLSSVF